MVNIDHGNNHAEQHFQLFIYDFDRAHLRRIDTLGDNKRSTAMHLTAPSWTKTGSELHYKTSIWDFATKKYVDSFHVFALQDGTTTETSAPASQKRELEKSPDEKLEAYLRENEDDPGFILVSTDGSPDRLCADAIRGICNFAWAPDSKAILLVARNEETELQQDLWCFDLLTDTLSLVVRKLDPEPVWTWSPDSSRAVSVCYAQAPDAGLTFNLFRRDINTSKFLTPMDDSTGVLQASAPAWSSDSEYFAVSKIHLPSPEDFEIRIYSKNGEQEHALFWPGKNIAGIYEMAWSV